MISQRTVDRINNDPSIEDPELYKERGHATRFDYIKSLSDDDELLAMILELAEVLGPIEDFDGLVVAIGDNFG